MANGKPWVEEPAEPGTITGLPPGAVTIPTSAGSQPTYLARMMRKTLRRGQKAIACSWIKKRRCPGFILLGHDTSNLEIWPAN